MPKGRPTLTGTTMKQTAIRLPTEMIAWLKAQPGSMSETIRNLVEDEMDEKMLNKLANMVHNEVCGCDDKTCETPQEIYDWLANGDAQHLTEADVPALVAEWKEYEGIE